MGLGHNRLSHIPDLSPLQDLSLLPIYSNRLTTIGEWIGNLKSLEKLDLSCNQINKLPNTIFNLSKLKYLNLKRNQIIDLPLPVGCRSLDCPDLETVDITENRIISLPFKLLELLVKVQIFKYSRNPFLSEAESRMIEFEKRRFHVPSLTKLCAKTVMATKIKDENANLIGQHFHLNLIHQLRNPKWFCDLCKDPFNHFPIHNTVTAIVKEGGIPAPFVMQICSASCLKGFLDDQLDEVDVAVAMEVD